MMLKLIIAIGAALALQTYAAQAAYFRYCDDPDPPYCAEDYGAFDDQNDFDSCLSEMESYKDDVEEYVECLSSNSREAADEYSDTVDSFNSRAGG